MKMSEQEKVYEIIIHGRGGQGAITAGELLCDFAYFSGFKDVLSIPIIGAERRGAPIKAFVKLSNEKEIKDYSAVSDPDISIIFDMSLLNLPGVLDQIHKGIVILNTKEKVDTSQFPDGVEVWAIDATKISLGLDLLVAGSPVLNVPILGAYAKVTGHIDLSIMEDILVKKFGSKGKLNYKATQEAAKAVHKLT